MDVEQEGTVKTQFNLCVCCLFPLLPIIILKHAPSSGIDAAVVTMTPNVCGRCI
jgi:hypothetical protein